MLEAEHLWEAEWEIVKLVQRETISEEIKAVEEGISKGYQHLKELN